MKRNIPTRLKAAFLVIIFSMNMIIGFACSVGIDMWFNTSHHHEETESIVHEGSRHHHKGDKHQKSKHVKHNCCNDHVIKFSRVDKSLPQPYAGLSAIFFTILISGFHNIDVLHTSKSSADFIYFVRNHHPPIPDIRVAIQSFQI